MKDREKNGKKMNNHIELNFIIANSIPRDRINTVYFIEYTFVSESIEYDYEYDSSDLPSNKKKIFDIHLRIWHY